MIRILTVLTCVGALLSPAAAGPLHDPFLEAFQVGTYDDPKTVDTAYGYPAGLLTSAEPDPIWIDAALRVLSGDPASGGLTRMYLSLNLAPSQAQAWLDDQAARVNNLLGTVDTQTTDGALAYENLALGFFQAVETGDLPGASDLSEVILDRAEALDLPGRVRFVWQLRRGLARRLAHPDTAPETATWPGLFELGPYDFSNAWALWTAHCRDQKLPPLPAEWHARSKALKLAGLRRSWLASEDISGSAFSADLKSGLGAKLLKDSDLAAHLKAHGSPPVDFSAQGWWVGGQRTHRRGESGFYESLAARDDLRDGWRMDVWRRASEIHLLAGRWTRGLDALDQALVFAADGAATDGLRKRLWQWTEQAAVLALAQGNTDRAMAVLERGLGSFKDEDLVNFRTSVDHWLTPTDTAPEGVKAAAVWTVSTGRAGPMRPADDDVRFRLAEAANQDIFQLWARWGLALCDHEDLTDAPGLESYRARLASLSHTDPTVSAVLETVHLRTGYKVDVADVLSVLLDNDIQNFSAGRTSPALSLMPGLARDLKGHWLDIHALLGLCLAAGDMRGGVALTYYLPSRGLTAEERLLFLYPLPGPGPLRDALLAAKSDPRLILAVARNESLFEPSIRSRAGALGWMQIMPFHYDAAGHRPGPGYWGLPRVSIGKGDGLLGENRRRYDANPYLALAAYNAGPGAASRWRKQLGGEPDNAVYLAWIGYPETRNYVEKVLIDREIYSWILTARR